MLGKRRCVRVPGLCVGILLSTPFPPPKGTADENSIRLFMSALASQSPWLYDPQTLPIPWRAAEETLSTKLSFGFGMGDGTVMPSPPLRRAMELTKSALIAAGHEVIDYIPTEHPESADIIGKMWAADGGEEFQRVCFCLFPSCPFICFLFVDMYRTPTPRENPSPKPSRIGLATPPPCLPLPSPQLGKISTDATSSKQRG
jgi:hypothetical protein